MFFRGLLGFYYSKHLTCLDEKACHTWYFCSILWLPIATSLAWLSEGLHMWLFAKNSGKNGTHTFGSFFSFSRVSLEFLGSHHCSHVGCGVHSGQKVTNSWFFSPVVLFFSRLNSPLASAFGWFPGSLNCFFFWSSFYSSHLFAGGFMWPPHSCAIASN